MAKIVFSYVAIFCLLILVSANTITTSLKKDFAKECAADLADEAEDQPVPSPVEEDTTQDDETSKLIPHHGHHASMALAGKLNHANYFLTSFHFLEIISPPPQV